MGNIEPGHRTSSQLAQYSFWRNETESQLRASCIENKVDPEEAVDEFRRFQAARRELLDGAEDSGEFLEGRFVTDHTETRQGGQGYVVFGHEKTTGPGKCRPVAIKHISRPPGIPSGEKHVPIEVEAIGRIPRSTKYLRRNLVEYLAIGFWDKADQNLGVTTVVMPRADLTLREFIQEHGALSPEDACRLIRILTQVIHGLQATMPDPVMHRDLKPENILLYKASDDADGQPDDLDTLWLVDGVTHRPVVADLGLAKRIVDAKGNAAFTEREDAAQSIIWPQNNSVAVSCLSRWISMR